MKDYGMDIERDEIYVLAACGMGIGRLFGMAEAMTEMTKKTGNYPKVVVGTSAGSIIGLALVLKVDIKQLIGKIAIDIDQKYIYDEYFVCAMLKYCCRGYLFETDIRKAIINIIFETSKYDSSITFKEIYDMTGIDFIVNGTEKNTNEHFYFCIHTTPNLAVYEAIMASSSLPHIFKPVSIIFPDSKERIIVDGAVKNFFCIDIFKPESKFCILNDPFIDKDFSLDRYKSYNIYGLYPKANKDFLKHLPILDIMLHTIDRNQSINSRLKNQKVYFDDNITSVIVNYIIKHSYFTPLNISEFFSDYNDGYSHTIKYFIDKKESLQIIS